MDEPSYVAEYSHYTYQLLPI